VEECVWYSVVGGRVCSVQCLGGRVCSVQCLGGRVCSVQSCRWKSVFGTVF